MFMQYKPQSLFEALGVFTYLSYHDPYNYRYWTVLDVASIIVPPVKISQYQIWIDKDKNPIGFLSWAIINEETEQILLEQGRLPNNTADWNNGDRLWFTDFICPFGHAHELIHDYIAPTFIDHKIGYSIRRGRDRSVRRYGQFFNRHHQQEKSSS